MCLAECRRDARERAWTRGLLMLMVLLAPAKKLYYYYYLLLLLLLLLQLLLLLLLLLILLLLLLLLLLQPLTIKYCQDDLRIFRASIALNRFPDQTPHSFWYEEAEKLIPRRATTNKQKSEVEFCNGSWTWFRRPNANPKTTTHLYSQSRVQL